MRYILVLTEAQRRTLIAAIRTASEEDCGPRIFRAYRDVENKVANALKVTRSAWSGLDYAIANSIQDEPEEVLIDRRQRKAADELWRGLASRLNPHGVTNRGGTS